MGPLSERKTGSHTPAHTQNSALEIVTACSPRCENAEKELTESNKRLGRDLIRESPSGARGRPLRVEDRNGEVELRTLAHFALDPDAAAVSFDKMLGDGEPQPGAADFAGTRNIHAVKAFEDARLELSIAKHLVEA